MIEAVAFCPQAPALVPEVGRGLEAELGELRGACADAVAHVCPAEHKLAIVGAGPVSRAFDPNARGSFAGFGVDLEVALGDGAGPVELPAALCVGAWLASGWGQAYSVGPDRATPGIEADVTALLVVGDGSARRDEKAPGYLDERAASYDADVEAALGSGDPRQLAALDPALGAQLLAAGTPVWSAVAPLLTGPYDAELRYAGAPFGVGYVVATWTRRSP